MSTTLSVVQAYDRKPIAEVPVHSAEDLEAKLILAEKTYRNRSHWMEPYKRIEILKKTATLVQKDQELFTRLIAQEGGKPYTDARVEVLRAIDGIENSAEHLRNFSGRQIPMGLTNSSINRIAFTLREPVGIVTAISAFNHPLNLIVHQICPAIATGCPVIIKPASATPLCCIELVKRFMQAGLPEAWCQTFISSDNQLAEILATDRRIGFLSFIGSAKVGWYLRSKLSPGTRCALEHGGVAPVIVDASADLKQAVTSITKGGYYHAGQVCVSVQRIYVHNQCLDAFMEKFEAEVDGLITGDPLDHQTQVGPLIHPRETTRVEQWIAEAVTMGAQKFGGQRLSETTLKPSILLNPSKDVKISKLEVFGPVCCVYPYENLDEAIHTANSLPYAFQASIFSQTLAPALDAARNLEAAAVMINDHTAFRTDWMPFAGHKQSGYGVGGIPSSMHEMTHEKMIVLKQ